MKRDWTIIRTLLQEIEAETLGQFSEWWGEDPAKYEGIDTIALEHKREQIDQAQGTIYRNHLELMLAGGLITEQKKEYMLTMRGYDLLEIMRHKELWNKLQKTVPLTTEIILQAALKYVSK